MTIEKTVPSPDLPPLPKKRRDFICTKCGSQQCKAGTEDQQYPPCARCDYLGFGGDIGYSDDEMRAYARAALSGTSEGDKPEEASAAELREAFGNLSDATLAGLAGADPEQIERIEQFILTECYPMHRASRGEGEGQPEPHPPNEAGETSCIVRWMVEMKGGLWLGAYDKEAFAAYRASGGVAQPAGSLREQWMSERAQYWADLLDEKRRADASRGAEQPFTYYAKDALMRCLLAMDKARRTLASSPP